MRRITYVGIAVGAQGVRVVMVSGGRIVGTGDRECSSRDALAAAVDNALDDALKALPQSRRLVAAAVVGPSASQVRLLPTGVGVPDRKTLEADLLDHTSRYFLDFGRPPVIASPLIQSDGAVWAAAFEADIVDILTDVCKSRRLRLVAIAPTVDALRLATTRSEVSWIDGAIAVETIIAANGELRSIRRRVHVPDGSGKSGIPVASLAALGDDAWRFGDAFAAAMVAGAPTRLALTGNALSGGRARSRIRLTVAATACAAGILAALVSPGFAARRAAAHAEAELASLGVARGRVMREYRALGVATATISAVDAIATRRRSMTLSIAALSRAVPESVFLTSLKLDGLGGTLIAIGPRAAAIVAELAAAPELDNPALVGAVTPHVSAGERLERATIRFQWSGRAR